MKEFLDFIDRCHAEYQLAYDAVSEEDKKLQDLLHKLEFSTNTAEKNRVATSLKNSRRERRRNKDIVKRNELIVGFFREKSHKDTLNKLRQLLGRQRKEEEYLASDRVYKPRAGK
jgi:hypothetical protein